MSLINDMLRDLDSRNAASSERSGLTHNIRALPQKPERRLHPLLLILVAASVGGAIVWLIQRPTVPATPVVTAAAMPPPAPVVAPAVPVLAPPAQASEPVAAAIPPPELAPSPPIETPPLRLDTQLDKPPAKSSSPIPKPVRSADAATPAQARPASPPTPLAVTPKPSRQVEVASRSNAPPQISKQPVFAGTPSEQADTDYRRGIAALRRADTTAAGEALRQALRLSPGHVAARQALLGLLTEQQRWSDAETLALDGVGLLPQRSEWALLAARLMYERGDADLALETLNQHAAAARQNADYQIMHALLLQRAGRHADAVNCYRTALTLRPNEGRWWFGLGRALDADHRENDARQAYEKARDSGNLPPDLLQNVERRLRQA